MTEITTSWCHSFTGKETAVQWGKLNLHLTHLQVGSGSQHTIFARAVSGVPSRKLKKHTHPPGVVATTQQETSSKKNLQHNQKSLIIPRTRKVKTSVRLNSVCPHQYEKNLEIIC